ncbi:MAG: DUF4139 domain-containing protein [archaeon]|nr:DUF4139 domain-containing protein [archaeon]
MKANLESRKSVRINWFKQEEVPFVKKRTMQWSYGKGNVIYNESRLSFYSEYVFSGLKKPIPNTSIIVFANDLPQSYMNTSGSVGDKFKTDKILDSDLDSLDRIVKVKQGEDKVITKPVAPHEAHIYKEIQIHERRDVITRKISIKNETSNQIKNIELTFIENKEIRFIESNPKPSKSEAPEYIWNMEIPGEESKIIEITVESHNKTVYKIEKEKTKEVILNNKSIQRQQNFLPDEQQEY